MIYESWPEIVEVSRVIIIFETNLNYPEWVANIIMWSLTLTFLFIPFTRATRDYAIKKFEKVW